MGFNLVWRTCVAESILFITPARGLIQKQKVLLRFRTHVLAKACFLRHQRGVSFKNNRFQYGGAAIAAAVAGVAAWFPIRFSAWCAPGVVAGGAAGGFARRAPGVAASPGGCRGPGD